LRKLDRRRRIVAAQPYRVKMDALCAAHRDTRQTIIFPPGLDWDEHLFQRPQQLARALAGEGALIFYMRPTPDFSQNPFVEISSSLYLCNVPVETFALLESPLIYLLTWNRTYAAAFDTPRIIYDYVDDIRVFDGNYRQLLQEHERLLQEAHLVLTTAKPLYRAAAKLRPDALLCPNGVDYAHFAAAREGVPAAPPADMEPILKRGNPIVGYYGALAEWFDYDLVMELARRRPDISFLIIGPDYDGTMPPSFLTLPNLDWLGIKPYAHLPAYLACLDVAMIPFQLNEITHATSPLKLFEYMAGGKPVVVTPMQESMRYDGVLVADGPDAFSRRIDDALQLRHDSVYLQRIDHTARTSTWAARAEQILSALDEIG
jgi:glycosyltransferase involved in cell wall biosynthesis